MCYATDFRTLPPIIQPEVLRGVRASVLKATILPSFDTTDTRDILKQRSMKIIDTRTFGILD